MKLSDYAQKQLENSTCCHLVLVHLAKNGEEFLAIYNGLANWARIEKDGVVVKTLSNDPEEDGYIPPFMESDFILAGYQVIG